MQKMFILGVSLFILPIFLGCETVNEGIDKTKTPIKAVGKTAGKVIDATGSITEGMVDGISDSDYDENPFNR